MIEQSNMDLFVSQVDVRCTVSAVGGFYYRDHLPILGKVALKRKEGSRKKKAVKQSFPEETVNDVAPVPANEEDARQCDQYCKRDRGDPKASPKEVSISIKFHIKYSFDSNFLLFIIFFSKYSFLK